MHCQKKMVSVTLVCVLMLFSCTTTGKNSLLGGLDEKAMDGWAAWKEKPSVELSIDRLNTARSIADLAEVTLNHMAISDAANWPRYLNTVSGFYRPGAHRPEFIINLERDGAYAAHGGQVPCAKKKMVLIQHRFYDLPPDPYSARGDFYENHDSTILHGTVYVIKGTTVTIRSDISDQELRERIGSRIQRMITKNESGLIERRSGKLKTFDLAGQKIYPTLMDALYGIAPNGADIRRAYNNFETAKSALLDRIETIELLKKEKHRFQIHGYAEGCEYKSLEMIKERLNIQLTHMKADREHLTDRVNILKTTFHAMDQYNGTVDDLSSVRVLLNVINATEGVQKLITDTITQTGIAVAHLVQAIPKVDTEMKALFDPSSAVAPRTSESRNGILGEVEETLGTIFGGVEETGQSTAVSPPADTRVWLPLRLEKLRYNFSNLKDSLSGIKHILTINSELVEIIGKKAGLLLDPQIASDIREAMDAEPLIHDAVVTEIRIQGVMTERRFDPAARMYHYTVVTRDRTRTFQFSSARKIMYRNDLIEFLLNEEQIVEDSIRLIERRYLQKHWQSRIN